VGARAKRPDGRGRPEEKQRAREGDRGRPGVAFPPVLENCALARVDVIGRSSPPRPQAFVLVPEIFFWGQSRNRVGGASGERGGASGGCEWGEGEVQWGGGSGATMALEHRSVRRLRKIDRLADPIDSVERS
jgi:hypothetical protein